MLEAFDTSSARPARPLLAATALSDAAHARLDHSTNVRRFIDRLLADQLPADALVVIARALPVPLLVAWGCECVKAGITGAGAAFEAERAAVALAEQCLREPTDQNRQLCLEFAERGRRATAGAWLAMAAAWADGNLAPPGSGTTVPAPPEAVSDTIVAALHLSAGGGAGRLNSYAQRALATFGARTGATS